MQPLQQGAGLLLHACVAAGGHVDGIVLAAQQQTAVGGAARIQIRACGFPQQRVAEKAQLRFRHGIGDQGVAAAVARHALLQPVLAGIARGDDQMPRADSEAGVGAQARPARGGGDLGHPRTVEDRCAPFPQALQQAMGQAVRIHARRLPAEQGGRGVEAVVRAYATGRQQFHLQPVLPARGMFPLQRAHVAAAAGVVQAAVARETHVAPRRGEPMQLVDGIGAGTVGQGGIGFAVALGQIDQMGVDLVLQQRRAGGRAAPAHVALFEDRHVEAMAGQFIRDQRTGNAATQHGHVASMVRFQARKGLHQAVADRPEGIPAFQIHACPASG